ncbi:MAG: VWA domain-containing protein [Lachnospiraceae bacterium]|nr:VWA domain-containing protein [Lachnospiraceae bacterium]
MMKKKGLKIAIVLAVVFIIAAIVGGKHLLNVHRINNLVQQQNYVASKLLEIGDYEQGKVLAMQNEQLQPNKTSRQLVVLAVGFQNDYSTGVRYAELYLGEEQDEIIKEAKLVMESFLLEEAKIDEEMYAEQCNELKKEVREELLVLLIRVQSAIEVKKTNESVQVMLDLMSSGSMQASEALKNSGLQDTSILSYKVQTAYAMEMRDYEEAFETAEKLYGKNDSIENRALLANIMASNGVDILESNQDVEDLKKQQIDLNNQINDLKKEYYNGELSVLEQQRINEKIEALENEIQKIQDSYMIEPVNRAINFWQTKTPVLERDTVAYKLELAQLYYLAKNENKAQELIAEIIKGNLNNTEPAAMLFHDFVNVYQMTNGDTDKPDYQKEELIDLKGSWGYLEKLLGFVENKKVTYSANNEEASFYQFVLKVLNEIYNGLIIRKIDATDFPTVRLTVNIAMELDEKLEQKDFTLTEMGMLLEDFRILNQEEAQKQGDMSVVLVVDRSGSMSGAPLEDTKKAVSNFVKNTDDNIQIGLVAFESFAELIAPISDNKNSILRGVQSIESTGGTSIYAGLQEAGSQLSLETGTKIIILLSDGADGSSYQIEDVLDELNRQNICVYTIGFGGADTEYLSYIASRCDGKFIQADSSEVLGQIYAAVGEYMVNDYIIEFEVIAEPNDFSRMVSVAVDANDAFDEREYCVGVPYEQIKAEQDQEPLANYFQQIGGSKKKE